MKKGLFITFEGPEGAGKSTLVRAAQVFLKRRKVPVLFLREPGGTAVSEKIREVLLHSKTEIAKEAELFLFLAARAQIVSEKILPALRAGKTVICDRFHDSTVAYQGYGSGVSLKLIESAGAFVKAGIEPDVTFLCDVDSKTGLRRAGRGDRMEKKSLAFHGRVRQGFLTLARQNKKRFVILKDERDIRVKIEKMRAALEQYLKK